MTSGRREAGAEDSEAALDVAAVLAETADTTQETLALLGIGGIAEASLEVADAGLELGSNNTGALNGVALGQSRDSRHELLGSHGLVSGGNVQSVLDGQSLGDGSLAGDGREGGQRSSRDLAQITSSGKVTRTSLGREILALLRSEGEAAVLAPLDLAVHRPAAAVIALGEHSDLETLLVAGRQRGRAWLAVHTTLQSRVAEVLPGIRAGINVHSPMREERVLNALELLHGAQEILDLLADSAELVVEVLHLLGVHTSAWRALGATRSTNEAIDDVSLLGGDENFTLNLLCGGLDVLISLARRSGLVRSTGDLDAHLTLRQLADLDILAACARCGRSSRSRSRGRGSWSSSLG